MDNKQNCIGGSQQAHTQNRLPCWLAICLSTWWYCWGMLHTSTHQLYFFPFPFTSLLLPLPLLLPLSVMWWVLPCLVLSCSILFSPFSRFFFSFCQLGQNLGTFKTDIFLFTAYWAQGRGEIQETAALCFWWSSLLLFSSSSSSSPSLPVPCLFAL